MGRLCTQCDVSVHICGLKKYMALILISYILLRVNMSVFPELESYQLPYVLTCALFPCF